MNEVKKSKATSPLRPKGSVAKTAKLPTPAIAATGYVENDMAKLRAAKAEVHKILLNAQRELELAKQIRANAEKYRQESEIKARSQAQLLILQTRLVTRKEIQELHRRFGNEVQNILADIRMIRITAQEELETQRKLQDEEQKILADIRMTRITAQEEFEAQRKFTDAARISALSLALQEKEREEIIVKPKSREKVGLQKV